MNKLFFSLIVCFIITLFTVSIYAEWVSGYTKSNGTYVNGYNRSDANDTVTDNYSYKGNVNPYTGSVGTNYYRNNPTSEDYDGSSENKSNKYWYK